METSLEKLLKGFHCYLLTDLSPNVTVVVTHQIADLIQRHVVRGRSSGVQLVTVGSEGCHTRVGRSFGGHVDGDDFNGREEL